LSVRVRLAFWPEPGTISVYMENTAENCAHSRGLQVVLGSEFRCRDCEERLDVEGVERWVRAAEEDRDEAYSIVEGDEFAKIVLEERQREVYRRRKVMYELRDVPRAVVARPEMILVSYDFTDDAYECRIFYKEPRPAWGLERVSCKAAFDSILALRSHSDPNVRLASGKIEEFHTLRRRFVKQNALPPSRRVFYQNEL
jgi:hypothetical protein